MVKPFVLNKSCEWWLESRPLWSWNGKLSWLLSTVESYSLSLHGKFFHLCTQASYFIHFFSIAILALVCKRWSYGGHGLLCTDHKYESGQRTITAVLPLFYYYVRMYTRPSHFSCVTLKSWEWPGDEARWLVQLLHWAGWLKNYWGTHNFKHLQRSFLLDLISKTTRNTPHSLSCSENKIPYLIGADD